MRRWLVGILLTAAVFCFTQADAFWQSRDSNYNRSVAAASLITSTVLWTTPNYAVFSSGSASAAITNSAGTGNTIVVAVRGAGGGTMSTLVDSAGNTYTMGARGIGSASIEIWYSTNIAHAIVGGTTTLTGSTVGGGSWGPLGIASIAGANGGIDVSTSTENVSGTTLTLSGTPAQANEIFVAATQAFDDPFGAAPGFTQMNASPTSGSIADFADLITSTIIAVNYSPTFGGSTTEAAAAMISLKH